MAKIPTDPFRPRPQSQSEKDAIVVNSFATECFRNIADKDYILARTSYRLRIIDQFLWSSLQAIEKYLKAILLYNGKSAKGLSHDIEKALKKVKEIGELQFSLDEEEERLIKDLNRFGKNRYLERETYTRGDELLVLDKTVWSIRRFCQVLNFSIETNSETINLLEPYLKMINRESYVRNPHKYCLIGGFLEDVLKKSPKDQLREALVWKNFYYGARKKKVIHNYTHHFHSVTPPHFRDAKLFQVLAKVVDFPNDIRKLFKAKEEGSSQPSTLT